MKLELNENGKLKRTAYMGWLKMATYPLVALEAVHSGTIENAWERLIGQQLFKDCRDHHHEQAFDIMDTTGEKYYTPESFIKAGKMVIESE